MMPTACLEKGDASRASERAFEIRSLSPPFKPHAKEKEMQMTLALFSPFSGFFLCGFDLTERKK